MNRFRVRRYRSNPIHRAMLGLHADRATSGRWVWGIDRFRNDEWAPVCGHSTFPAAIGCADIRARNAR